MQSPSKSAGQVVAVAARPPGGEERPQVGGGVDRAVTVDVARHGRLCAMLPMIVGNDGSVISTTARPFRIPISAYSRPDGET